jgi:hypothetical protein
MQRNTKTVVIGGLALASLATWAAQTVSANLVIYSDNFDGSSGVVAGRTPDVVNGVDGGTTGATWTSDAAVTTDPDAIWTASGGTYTGVGTTNASLAGGTDTFSTGADSNLITNAYLPFTPQSGFVYDLELNIASSGTGASGNWLGLAFAQTGLNGHTTGGASSALSNDSTAGLILLKGSGLVQSFGGTVNGSGDVTSSTGNQVLNATLTSPGTSTPVYTQVDIILNTIGSQWVVSWELNGATSGADFGTYTYPVGDNPTAIGDVIFGTNKLTGVVSTFSLSVIPEPASLGLLGLGSLFLVGRRRNLVAPRG